MSVATHLGIDLRNYDAQIRTFIPWYDEMLDAAAESLRALAVHRPLVVDLGTGSGALAARCLSALPRARIVGIDADRDILALAERRLGRRLSPLAGNFLRTPLPRCDAITASFSLHHVATRARKAALYARCRAALRRGGLFVSADCCLASDARVRARDRAMWRAHLERTYSKRRAEAYLRAWAREDFYFTLDEELTLLRSAGLTTDVLWRKGSFAVISGGKGTARGAPRDRIVGSGR